MNDETTNNWENLYSTKRHISVWPWTDLVSLVKRNKKPLKDASVLELGVGMGANIPFFMSEQCDYWGIEFSKTAVRLLVERYPTLNGKIQCHDFSKNFIDAKKFDLIFDRASITHNHTKDIKNTIQLIRNSLQSDGLFIGIDWFSTKWSDYNQGRFEEDKYTKSGFTEGFLADTGVVHFFDKQHLVELFSEFEFIALEHKTYDMFLPEATNFAAWNFVARKK